MRRPGDLIPRLAVAVVGIPVVFGALYLGGWVLGGILAAIAVVGTWEFYNLVKHRGDTPFRILGSLASVAVILAATRESSFGLWAADVAIILMILVGAVLGLSLVLRWPGGSPLGALSATTAGVLYVAVPLGFIPLLRALPETIPGVEVLSPWTPMSFVLLPLLITWASDTAAYFVGHAVGKTKLAPSISPGKSVEGAIGGVVGAVGAGVLMASWWFTDLPLYAITLPAAAGIGAVVSVAGQTGDLVESVLKREAGVKDSGAILPGHGGILDRLDALLWAFPVTWGLLAWMQVL